MHLSETELKELNDQWFILDQKVNNLDEVIRSCEAQDTPYVRHLKLLRKVLMTQYQMIVYKLTDTPLPQ